MVRWKKLQLITKDLVNRSLLIVGATVGINGFAVVGFNEDSVSIAINLNLVKTEEKTIDVVAHEVAHVLLKSDTHDMLFDKKWKEVKEYITNKMNEIN